MPPSAPSRKRVAPKRVAEALLLAATLAFAAGAASCVALFPELSTPISAAPKTGALDPPPPPDRHFVKVVGAKVPPKARDGRSWDQVFGSMPDPNAKVFVNDAEILTTGPESDTLEPHWKDAPSGNFLLAVGDKVRVEVWNSNTFADSPIGIRELTLTGDMLDVQEIVFELSGGGELTLAVQPARAVWGGGYWFELRNDSAYVTRVLDSSPASRGGMKPGDRILMIDNKPVDKMSVDEVRSLLAAVPTTGRALALQHDGGGTLQLTLKEGPIYPLFKDYSQLPLVP